MYIVTRRMGSQRASRPIKVKIMSNFAGDGGYAYLSFQKEDGTYLNLYPESDEEVKQLLSAVHIVHHNFTTAQIIPMRVQGK